MNSQIGIRAADDSPTIQMARGDDLASTNSMIQALPGVTQGECNDTSASAEEFNLSQLSLGEEPLPEFLDKRKIQEIAEVLNAQTQYQVESFLNAGGQGIVYQVKDNSTGKLHIAKYLHAAPIAALVCEEGDISTHLREVYLPNRLNHSGIAQVEKCLRLRDHENKDIIVLISEYDPTARPLKDLIAEDRMSSPIEVVNFLCATLEILRDIHDPYRNREGLRIIHSDIKPGNILVKDSGEIVLIDLGVARQIIEGQTHMHTVNYRGTPTYTAIEQFLGDGIPASDIYSLGVTAIECLLGHIPPGLQKNILSEKPYQLPVDSPIPARLREVLNVMVHPDAEKRFADAQLALNALVSLKDEKILMSPPEAHSTENHGRAGSLMRHIAGQILGTLDSALRGVGSFLNKNLLRPVEWVDGDFCATEKSSLSGFIRSLITLYNKASIATKLPKGTLNSDAKLLFENVSAVLAGGFSSYMNREFVALEKGDFLVRAQILPFVDICGKTQDDCAVVKYEVYNNGIRSFSVEQNLSSSKRYSEQNKRQKLGSFSDKMLVQGGIDADVGIRVLGNLGGSQVATMASVIVALLDEVSLLPRDRLQTSLSCPGRSEILECHIDPWSSLGVPQLVKVAWHRDRSQFLFGDFTFRLTLLENALEKSNREAAKDLKAIDTKIEALQHRLNSQFPRASQPPERSEYHKIERELPELRQLIAEACSICREALLNSQSPLVLFAANNVLQAFQQSSHYDEPPTSGLSLWYTYRSTKS